MDARSERPPRGHVQARAGLGPLRSEVSRSEHRAQQEHDRLQPVLFGFLEAVLDEFLAERVAVDAEAGGGLELHAVAGGEHL